MTDRPLLETQALSLHVAGGGAIVDTVSLTLRAGGTIGIAGESGCGKSSLLLAMMGIVKPGLSRHSGACRFDGVDIFEADEAQLDSLRGRRIAMVPQNAVLALTPTIRIGDHIDEVLRLHSDASPSARQARILELLARMGLPDPPALARRFPHQLSGGQLQRVAIAMAIACRPAVLLLDEPTTGLDVTTRAAILDLLVGLQREYGLAMVCVSHDVGVLARLGERMVVMYAGRIIEDRATPDLLARPAHPYTRALLASVPTLSKRRLPSAIPGRPPRAGEARTGCSFAPRCAKVTELCRAEQPALADLPTGGRAACIIPAAGPLDIATDTETGALSQPLATMAAITVDDLAISYVRSWMMARFLGGRTPANVVEGVSFTLQQGEILALIGESGSGKSTILKVLAGLWPASGGRLRLGEGHDLTLPATRRPRAALRAMQMVFQNPDASLNPRHTVREILAQPMRLYFAADARTVEERATKLLADVRLDRTYLDRYPEQMSGGERQRVALARAFAAEPDVILCDEVTSALDVSVQASVLRLIRDLCRARGTACLFVAHDLAVVAALADRVAVLRHGRLVEIGSVEAICDRPQNDYTRTLLAAALDPASA